jgi:hypothetical protein
MAIECKNLKKRNAVVEEIINTEDDYINAMIKARRYYCESCKEGILIGEISVTVKQIDDIFMHVDSIINLNNDLLDLLKEKFSCWTNDSTLGDVFESMVYLFFRCLFYEYTGA